MIDGPAADAFVQATQEALSQVAPQTMLTDGIADAYRAGCDRIADGAGMPDLARGLHGQLTCTLQLDAGDTVLGQPLLPVPERKAGRVPAKGFPTGVEVADAMVHGGTYPASTNLGATSVGTLSIRRWLRPVCFQNLPEVLLPEDLRDPATRGQARRGGHPCASTQPPVMASVRASPGRARCGRPSNSACPNPSAATRASQWSPR